MTGLKSTRQKPGGDSDTLTCGSKHPENPEASSSANCKEPFSNYHEHLINVLFTILPFLHFPHLSSPVISYLSYLFYLLPAGIDVTNPRFAPREHSCLPRADSHADMYFFLPMRKVGTSKTQSGAKASSFPRAPAIMKSDLAQQWYC